MPALDSIFEAVRVATLFVVAVFAVICVVDWAVRTKRINAFNPIARYFRSTIDPFIAPIERRVVRAGGSPAVAPWWALVAAVVGAILLLSLLGFVRNQVLFAALAADQGAAGVFRLLVVWTFAILRLALIVRVISSWLPVNPHSPWLRWSYLLSEPILRPLRQIVPTLGMIDITPILAYFLLGFLARILVGAL
ncbi:MAG TPA: YggT family protein [Gemmatimonadaceae bacterium]|nr:YggT family protein [Gemmatimonadaceae bacterium]